MKKMHKTQWWNSVLGSQLSCDDVYTSIQCKITPQTTPWVWNGEILFAFHIMPILHVLDVDHVRVQKKIGRKKNFFLTFKCSSLGSIENIFALSTLTSTFSFIRRQTSLEHKIQTTKRYRTRQLRFVSCKTHNDSIINFTIRETCSDSFFSFNTQHIDCWLLILRYQNIIV